MVRSLGAGGDKGETWLPPRRLVEHLYALEYYSASFGSFKMSLKILKILSFVDL